MTSCFERLLKSGLVATFRLLLLVSLLLTSAGFVFAQAAVDDSVPVLEGLDPITLVQGKKYRATLKSLSRGASFSTCLRPRPFTAVDIRTGQVVWRNPSIGRATAVLVDKRFILLDEDGILALATPTAEGLTINSKIQLLTNSAWTVPTLAGTALYVRDRKDLMALDLK